MTNQEVKGKRRNVEHLASWKKIKGLLKAINTMLCLVHSQQLIMIIIENLEYHIFINIFYFCSPTSGPIALKVCDISHYFYKMDWELLKIFSQMKNILLNK